MNLILKTDSYKLSHFKQYPPKTTKVFSYLESRGGKYPATIMFGLQYYLKEYLTKPITQKNIEEADSLAKEHGVPFNREGWQHILDEHQGKLPLRIRAVPEGMLIPTSNVLMTIENTDPKCFWLTNYVETLLLKIWYPITVATTSFYIKKLIKNNLEASADNLDGLDFKLHDFGYRGVSSEESAAIGAAAHLINFKGTDTIAGIEFLRKYYSAPVAGFSIPASEHSTITSWGEDGELEAYENMLDQYKDSPIVACVSDSYNIYEACRMWGKLKDKIIKNNQTLVVRPDSGDPVEVILGCLAILNEEFGSTINTKGYKLLKNVRIIWGDGINGSGEITKILYKMQEAGYSADNIAFGMGGGLLQKLDRDTQKFAIKCSAVIIDGKVREVFKNPSTDPGKRSKKGFLDLVEKGCGSDVMTWSVPTRTETSFCPQSVMDTVFENGKITKEYTYEEILARRDSSND